ncbi:MAG: hypothetical protein KKA54_03330 [Proteobacteria bacterium]|nr:hypothetical protein [Pseudomonadota bacterium]MBU0965395.1 hypothetical protein [Pseudomonadota bacterium]
MIGKTGPAEGKDLPGFALVETAEKIRISRPEMFRGKGCDYCRDVNPCPEQFPTTPSGWSRL